MLPDVESVKERMQDVFLISALRAAPAFRFTIRRMHISSTISFRRPAFQSINVALKLDELRQYRAWKLEPRDGIQQFRNLYQCGT